MIICTEPGCNRYTLVKYGNTLNKCNAYVRIRECSAGHKLKTIEYPKETHKSLQRALGLLERAEKHLYEGLEHLQTLIRKEK